MDTREIVYTASHFPYRHSGEGLPEKEVQIGIKQLILQEHQTSFRAKHPEDQNILIRRMLFQKESERVARDAGFDVKGPWGQYTMIVDQDLSERGGLNLWEKYGFDKLYDAALTRDRIVANDISDYAVLAWRRFNTECVIFLVGYEISPSVQNGDYFVGLVWSPEDLHEKCQEPLHGCRGLRNG